MTSIEFPVRLSVAQAHARILERCAVQRLDAQRVSLDEALGRYLANDIVAPHDVPPFGNSSMDGFALRGCDLPVAGERRFRVLGTRLAGTSEPVTIGAGQCLRVTTGAALPPGADTVVIKERVRIDGMDVVVATGEVAGAYVRAAGEDYCEGDVALRAGQRLTAARLGVLASFGMTDVSVARRPRVALFTTGDELQAPGQVLATAQIHDSNRHTLGALIAQAGGDLVRVCHLRDERDALRASLLDAAAEADVIITSGGVSAGEADFLPDLISRIGTVHFWKVRMRPGMPLLYGEIGRSLIWALPGNPVSSMVSFLALAAPGLAMLQGANEVSPRRFARLSMPFQKRHDRAEFVRARLESHEDGTLWTAPLSGQGSGMLRSMADAECLIVLDEAACELAAGSVVEILPLSH